MFVKLPPPADEDLRVNFDEERSLFIGFLPGSETRQVVLFPGGHVLADLCEHEIETPTADPLPDRGWSAACALIKTLNDGGGWYIEESTGDGNGWWLKPRPDNATPSITIRGATLRARTDEPESVDPR
jgi:hypothetical protein